MKGSIQYEIIGSFLTDERIHHFIDSLEADDFDDLFCKKAMEGIKKLRAGNMDITIYNLKNITNMSIKDIMSVMEAVTTTARIEQNIKTLKEHAARKRLLEKSEEIKYLVEDNTKTVTEIKNEILHGIEAIKEYAPDNIESMKDSMLETYEILEMRHKHRDRNRLFTGITKLDMLTAGLHPEELTTIASRPAVGKSILGMQIALSLVKQEKKVLFVTLEMSTSQLCERIIAANTGIDGNKLRLGEITTADDWSKIQKVASSFSFENLLLDKTSRTVQQIRSKILKYKPDAVIIDYLQLLQPVTKEYSREREVAVITRELKMMTLDFKIPIVIMAQLNRNADGNRPTLADLRESGAIEQDSDNVILLHEPKEKEITSLISEGVYTEFFFIQLAEWGHKLVYIIVEKQRNGGVGSIPMIKKPKYMKFAPVD